MAIVNFPTEQPLRNPDAPEVILVVEDEDEVRKVVCLTLELQGYQVLAAPSPLRALELVRSLIYPIDLLITDVVMPELSGPELVARVRQSIPNLRALYMSGYSEEALLTHGLVLSEIAFLAKPFSSAALGRKVRQVLRQSEHNESR